MPQRLEMKAGTLLINCFPFVSFCFLFVKFGHF